MAQYRTDKNEYLPNGGTLHETILQLGRNNLGTEPQIFTIAVACIQSNKDAFTSLSWVEVR